jgi:hypothetical protein
MNYFLLILIIVLFPLPIKLSLHFVNNNLKIYIYNINITYKRRVTKKASLEIKSKDYIGRIKFYYRIINSLHDKLKNNLFKPYTFISLHLVYGFDDAALTGICYGFFYSFSPALYSIFNNYFHLKKYELSICPDYENSKFNFQCRGILFLSLVNTIYIVILVLIGFREGKKINRTCEAN